MTAATIRAELGDVTRFQRVDAVVAYAGLDPRTRQSGAFVGQKQLSARVLYATPAIWPRLSPPAVFPSGEPATSGSWRVAMPSKKPTLFWPAPS